MRIHLLRDYAAITKGGSCFQPDGSPQLVGYSGLVKGLRPYGIHTNITQITNLGRGSPRVAALLRIGKFAK